MTLLFLFPVRAAGQLFSVGCLNVRYVRDTGFVASDVGGRPLFVVYPFDNGPDPPAEGLFRIVGDGRIGYADTLGRVVVPPRFGGAEPFREGRAAVCPRCREVREDEHRRWSGGRWGFIDRAGRMVIPPHYDRVISPFHEGRAVVLLAGDTLVIDTVGKPVDMENTLTDTLEATLRLVAARLAPERGRGFLRRTRRLPGFEPLREEALVMEEVDAGRWYFVPWQPLTETEALPGCTLAAVTPWVLLFREGPPEERVEKRLMRLLMPAEGCPNAEKGTLPEGLVILARREHRCYLELEVALPGSRLPPSWEGVAGERMLRLVLVPDTGTPVVRWIAPSRRRIPPFDGAAALARAFPQ